MWLIECHSQSFIYFQNQLMHFHIWIKLGNGMSSSPTPSVTSFHSSLQLPLLPPSCHLFLPPALSSPFSHHFPHICVPAAGLSLLIGGLWSLRAWQSSPGPSCHRALWCRRATGIFYLCMTNVPIKIGRKSRCWQHPPEQCVCMLNMPARAGRVKAGVDGQVLGLLKWLGRRALG